MGGYQFHAAANDLRLPDPPDLLGNFSRLMQLHDLAQQSQLRQQQLQGEQLRNQQAQQQLQSRQGLVKTINEAKGDPSKVNLETLTANNVLPGDADNFLKAQLSQQQATAALDANTRNTIQAIDEKAADIGQYVKGIKDPTKRQVAIENSKAYMQQFIQQQQALNPDMKQQALQHIAQLQTHASDDDLDAFIALHNNGASITKSVQEQQKDASEIFKNTEQGNEAAANVKKIQTQLPGIQAESQAKANFAVPQARAELGKT